MECSLNTTRRRFLSGAIAASSVAIPVTVLAAAPKPVDPRERVEAAVAELRAALEAYDPTIAAWTEFIPEPAKNPDKPNNLCRFILAAYHPHYAA